MTSPLLRPWSLFVALGVSALVGTGCPSPAAGVDVGTHDAGTPDAGLPDAGCVAGPNPIASWNGTAPDFLSQTGLYTDVAGEHLAPGVRKFQPTYKLWSDGAEKQRFLLLPACTPIDTQDMDHWDFPVGTRFWKDFTVDGKRLETRLIARTGTGLGDWVFLAYQWPQDGGDAFAVPDGVADAGDTPHDIPSVDSCLNCHTYLQERILGFGAIELSHEDPDGGETLTTLSNEGVLSVPHPAPYVIPGDDKTVAALGYLHANCGPCHNPSGVPFSGADAGYSLRLHVDQLGAPEDTDAYLTAVGKPLREYANPNAKYRVWPGDAGGSAIVVRMSARGDFNQMPPLATEFVDPDGLAAVTGWINSLSP